MAIRDFLEIVSLRVAVRVVLGFGGGMVLRVRGDWDLVESEGLDRVSRATLLIYFVVISKSSICG